MFAKIKNYRYLLLVSRQLVAVLILCLCLTLTALANPGDLDLTFDTDGKVITSIGALQIGQLLCGLLSDRPVYWHVVDRHSSV